MGKVMGMLKSEFQGNADMGLVSKIVKESLTILFFLFKASAILTSLGKDGVLVYNTIKSYSAAKGSI